jgi:tRNA A-37 threonylcarbamoyl transferase component Bud32
MKEDLSLVSAARRGKQKPNTRSSKKKHSKKSMRVAHVNDLSASQVNQFDRIAPHELRGITAKFGKQFLSSLPKGYHLSKKLGSGVFGVTFSICKNNFECLAIKVQQFTDKNAIMNEVKMQKIFHKHGIAPAIIGSPKFYKHKGKDFAVIVMSRIDVVMQDLLDQPITDEAREQIWTAIVSLLSTMRKYKLAHNDMHWENLAMVYAQDAHGRLTMRGTCIDFGWSFSGKSSTSLEVLQLIRTLDRSYSPNINKKTQQFLLTRLIALYEGSYDGDVRHQASVEALWTREMDEAIHYKQRTNQ